IHVMLLSALGLVSALPEEVWSVPNPKTPHSRRKGPLRVLIFAGAPNREYQFVRALFKPEVMKGRMQVAFFIQTGFETELDPDTERKWCRERFPDAREPVKKGKQGYVLFDYDVVIAFDPDWTKVPAATLKLLEEWVAKREGTLVLFAGPVHTWQLARPRKNKD